MGRARQGSVSAHWTKASLAASRTLANASRGPSASVGQAFLNTSWASRRQAFGNTRPTLAATAVRVSGGRRSTLEAQGAGGRPASVPQHLLAGDGKRQQSVPHCQRGKRPAGVERGFPTLHRSAGKRRGSAAARLPSGKCSATLAEHLPDAPVERTFLTGHVLSGSRGVLQDAVEATPGAACTT